METKKILNIVVAAFVLLIGYVVVDKLSGDNDFARKMDRVRSKQDSLLRIIDSLERTTNQRDRELKELVETNLAIIQSLNGSIKISKKKQDSIKQIITATQRKIDSLWSANPE